MYLGRRRSSRIIVVVRKNTKIDSQNSDCALRGVFHSKLLAELRPVYFFLDWPI